MPVKKGYLAKMYRDTGTFGSPTWNEVDVVKDIAYTYVKESLEASTRASGKVKEYEPGRGDFTITGKIRSDEDSADFVAFETAFLADSLLDIMILDGGSTVNGSRGYRMEFKLHKLDEDQAEDGILYREFELKPCISSNAKQSVLVASGAPAFTALALA